MLHRFTHTVLATVPEDNEESAGGHGNCMHEHPIGDATAFTGFYRDHRIMKKRVAKMKPTKSFVQQQEQCPRAHKHKGNLSRKRHGLPISS